MKISKDNFNREFHLMWALGFCMPKISSLKSHFFRGILYDKAPSQEPLSFQILNFEFSLIGRLIPRSLFVVIHIHLGGGGGVDARE